MKACQKTRARREPSQEGSSFSPTLEALRRQYSFRDRRWRPDGETKESQRD